MFLSTNSKISDIYDLGISYKTYDTKIYSKSNLSNKIQNDNSIKN